MRVIPKRDDWPPKRRVIGASHAQIILKGEVKYGRDKKTLTDLWRYLTYKDEAPEQSDKMKLGLHVEPRLMKMWEEFIRLTGEPINTQDDEHDFLVAQIDWLSYDGTRMCDFKHTTSEWLWNEAQKILAHTTVLTEGTKLDNWYSAAQHQLMVTGLGMVDYYLVWQEFGQAHFMVPRNDEYIAELRAKEIAFWQNHVLTDTPPPTRKLRLRKDPLVEQERSE